MKRTIQIAVVLFALLPGIAKAQWTFDIVSDRKSSRLNSSHMPKSRMPSSA